MSSHRCGAVGHRHIALLTECEREPAAVLQTFDSSGVKKTLPRNLPQRCKQQIVLVGSSDAYAKIIFEHRIAAHVSNQDAAPQKFLINATRTDRRTRDHEVRSRAYGSQPFDARQFLVEPITLGGDSPDERLKLRLVLLDCNFRGRLRKRIQIVGQHRFCNFCHKLRGSQKVTDAQLNAMKTMLQNEFKTANDKWADWKPVK